MKRRLDPETSCLCTNGGQLLMPPLDHESGTEPTEKDFKRDTMCVMVKIQERLYILLRFPRISSLMKKIVVRGLDPQASCIPTASATIKPRIGHQKMSLTIFKRKYHFKDCYLVPPQIGKNSLNR
ncbi:hypothetical protein CDAR_311621 [Caerostris darwini]|uniref:Uncharacterized protein n=1 Tax=Caerostris darwini TaxID=1538125 RepID=A0AAV4UT41_9ARAC|nr:hypothetical protein CDAR_311621 [Caerostris darwini]